MKGMWPDVVFEQLTGSGWEEKGEAPRQGKLNQYFKNYCEPGALPDAFLKNPQLVKKWRLNQGQDQSIVSRGYKIM